MKDDVEQYVANAAEHGHCTETRDFKRGHAAFDRMEAALGRLRQRDDKGESILRELLSHPNGWVRLASATHLLPLRTDCACKTLERLASGPQSYVEFNAKMVLREWRSGTLKVS
jgi:hypothetical protein